MTFDTKIAIILYNELAVWQKLNVTGFLASGIASQAEVVGEPYEDGSGIRYLPMIKQPITIFGGSKEQLKYAHRVAKERNLTMSVFIEELFSTPNDEENRAAVRSVTFDQLNLVGLGLRGPKKAVDKALNGCPLHK